ncbi:MAG: SDR family oxidoreductase [Bacteroidota bacterium]
MSQLQDKVAIITGSTMGIGKTLALKMAAQGAKIVLNGRNAERLQRSLKTFEEAGYTAIGVAGDVSKVADCQKLITESIAAFGRIDILVNNAGISTEGTVAELRPEVFAKVMDVNYMGSVYPTQLAIPHLTKSRGHVLFISSVAGIRGIPNYAVYSSSKMALTALAEALKIELDHQGIHVGIAYVGFTENDPDKTIYDAQGQLIPQPKRGFVKAESPDVVAQRLIRMIEHRQFKRVFTPLGKLNALINRISPFIVHRVLRNNYRKTKAEG